MQRGSDRLSFHRDDEMKHEMQGMLRSGHPTRAVDWRGPEPPADDDPELWRGPVVPATSSEPSLESVRLELARFLGRGAFPAGPDELAGRLRRGNAPDELVEGVQELAGPARFNNLEALAEALTHA
ncbi:DUF2795 domain-containing protein [Streptomyces sp. V3I7]|uniref:DUF2795 domain-containing protein n=1 Tax=Streptomyces sp. V3I7 TaxID=3042278 RepID=UPI00277F01E2|nr:DUF2795 domain-containing protein [Streptomyces sp. V3I7]MDQ0993949.1 hypothetical protein [Streptomyces sp. V3I7]